MTNQRLTQCPHCKASFKVSEDQLNAANGRVRCGACMNIFDAIAYSIATAPNDEKQDKQTSSIPTHSENTSQDLEASILEQEDEDNTLFQDNPDEDKKEEGYRGLSQISDEYSPSFLDLINKENDENASPYLADAAEIELVDNEDESWTEAILENENQKNETKIEPHISNSSIIEHTEKHEELQHYSNEINTEKESEDKPKEHYDSLNFYAPQTLEPKGRHWLVSLSLMFAIFVFIIALIAQASWMHYEKLAKYPQAVTLYTKICTLLNCQLPTLSDITRIKSHNLIVRSHPTTRKALIIDAVITNDADYDQAFPDIALYFSDINNKTIAQRLIHPKEYLTGEILTWEKMPSKQPIHISLELIDPGKTAVNYKLEFFLARTNQENSKNSSIVNQ